MALYEFDSLPEQAKEKVLEAWEEQNTPEGEYDELWEQWGEFLEYFPVEVHRRTQYNGLGTAFISLTASFEIAELQGAKAIKYVQELGIPDDWALHPLKKDVIKNLTSGYTLEEALNDTDSTVARLLENINKYAASEDSLKEWAASEGILFSLDGHAYSPNRAGKHWLYTEEW